VDRLTRAMAVLLRRSMMVLPADRREWAEAVLNEAADVPPGWPRLAWLAGGLRLTVLQAALVRRCGCALAFAAAAAGVAWSAWSGPPGDPAVVINRVDVITMVVILAALPAIVGRIRGQVSARRPARLVRTGGYATILALVLVKTAVRRVADAPPNNLGGATAAWAGEVVFLAVMVGYAALILACTARRSPAVPATVAGAVAAGTAIGVIAYALGPLGFPLRFAGPWPARLYDAALALGVYLAVCAPLAAGLAAAWRNSRSRARSGSGPGTRLGMGHGTRSGMRSGMRQGALAGLCTGAAAALVVSVLSTATIALLPYASGLREWGASHIGHWTPVAGQWGQVLGPGTRLGYVAGNSAFAAGFLLVLLLGPLLGCAFGAWGARTWHVLTQTAQPNASV
jgi:hypothetical protein